jgi:hypothetical protein
VPAQRSPSPTALVTESQSKATGLTARVRARRCARADLHSRKRRPARRG